MKNFRVEYKRVCSKQVSLTERETFVIESISAIVQATGHGEFGARVISLDGDYSILFEPDTGLILGVKGYRDEAHARVRVGELLKSLKLSLTSDGMDVNWSQVTV